MFHDEHASDLHVLCYREPMIRSCSRCHQPHRRNHSWCADCHAAYMREWRRDHPLDDQQKARDSARSYANVYLARGKLQRGPCEDCGVTHNDQPVKMHHEDYAKPLDVTWLCDWCHQDRHTPTD